MTALADAGTGNYYYVAGPARPRQRLRARVRRGAHHGRLGPGGADRAGRGVRVVDAAGYPLEPTATRVVFRPGALFAGQERRIWVTLAVPHAGARRLRARPLLARPTASGGSARTLALQRDAAHRLRRRARTSSTPASTSTPGAASVVVDGYNKMQQEVAREVKDGRRDEALQRLRRVRGRDRGHERAPPVRAGRRRSSTSARQARGRRSAPPSTGPIRPARQNELSKSTGAAALDARRAGARSDPGGRRCVGDASRRPRPPGCDAAPRSRRPRPTEES